MPKWTFITNHGLVLSYISRHPESTARVISQAAGITERTAHKIIAELEEAGYIARNKIGRQNQYKINANLPLRHLSDNEVAIGELLRILGWKGTEVAKEQMKLL